MILKNKEKIENIVNEFSLSKEYLEVIRRQNIVNRKISFLLPFLYTSLLLVVLSSLYFHWKDNILLYWFCWISAGLIVTYFIFVSKFEQSVKVWFFENYIEQLSKNIEYEESSNLFPLSIWDYAKDSGVLSWYHNEVRRDEDSMKYKDWNILVYWKDIKLVKRTVRREKGSKKSSIDVTDEWYIFDATLLWVDLLTNNQVSLKSKGNQYKYIYKLIENTIIYFIISFSLSTALITTIFSLLWFTDVTVPRSIYAWLVIIFSLWVLLFIHRSMRKQEKIVTIKDKILRKFFTIHADNKEVVEWFLTDKMKQIILLVNSNLNWKCSYSFIKNKVYLKINDWHNYLYIKRKTNPKDILREYLEDISIILVFLTYLNNNYKWLSKKK